uniref:Uncharacterized protein n=1 Tax=Meloidogyne javanica TaxID=6303 RepID=A0A915MSA3_MELJA
IGWFPPCSVNEEVSDVSFESNNSSSELNYGTIELAGTSFEENVFFLLF